MPYSSPQPVGCGAVTPAGAPSHDAEWNAGDLACGELVLELRLRTRALKSGQVLRLTASDPGAPADIPSWCRMTGHLLLYSDLASALYFIQRP